uniref:ATP synthase complex subunit 8 n=1 Tax=Mylabris calida TaxID=268453 RepID=A0A7H1DNJ8_9CUCU|nr:ATP synthase F0 subunit 8 [Mylabris calida]QNS38543.1 ATP synthase F0 subunit 8 [Mylabris calida]
MPQMAPLNWLTLLFFFIMIFIILNSFNYYTFTYQKKMGFLDQKASTKINWKCL